MTGSILVVLGAAWFAAAEGGGRNPYYPQFPSRTVAARQLAAVGDRIETAERHAEILGGWNAEQRIDYAFRLRHVRRLWEQVFGLADPWEGDTRDDAAERLRAIVGERDFNMGWIPWGPQ